MAFHPSPKRPRGSRRQRGVEVYKRAQRRGVRHTLAGTDHRSHHEQDTAIGDYVRWHNRHAQPKTGFAINSKIRDPDYLANVA
jgi:hypothetical protein